jgi:hypothetical protein
MKALYRYLATAVVAGLLTLSQSAWAGECCKKSAGDVRAGKACSKCLEHNCCKKVAERIAEKSKEKGKAKTCAKCAKAAEEKKRAA